MRIFITNISPQNAIFLYRTPESGELKFYPPLLSGEQIEIEKIPREFFEKIRVQFAQLSIVSMEEYYALADETRIFVFSENEPLSERVISQLMESYVSRYAKRSLAQREQKMKSIIGEMIAESKKEGIFNQEAVDDYSFEVRTIEHKGKKQTSSLTEKYQLPADKRR